MSSTSVPWDRIINLFVALGSLVATLVKQGKDPVAEIRSITRSVGAKGDASRIWQAAFDEKFGDKPESD